MPQGKFSLPGSRRRAVNLAESLAWTQICACPFAVLGHHVGVRRGVFAVQYESRLRQES